MPVAASLIVVVSTAAMLTIASRRTRVAVSGISEGSVMLVPAFTKEFPKDAEAGGIVAELLEPRALFDVESFAREN